MMLNGGVLMEGEGLTVTIWQWIITNVGVPGVMAILLLLLFIWLQEKNHNKNIKYLDRIIKTKEDEIVRMTEDRNEYKKFFFEKYLKSSQDEEYSGTDKPKPEERSDQ